MLTIVLVSALVAAVLAWLILRSGIAKFWLDIPIDRSLHVVPTPRLGGVALFLAGALAWPSMASTPPPISLCISLALVFGVSLIDDHRSLPASVRLLVHLIAALLWSLFLTDNALIALLLCLAIVWMTNLFNFMDGSDGLAAGMSVIGFLALGLIAQGSAHPLAWPCFVAAGATTGFLLFNFPPARLFMGDAGSVPLGFLAGAIAAWGLLDGLWTIWIPLLVFAPFIFDASFTLLARLARGAKPWEAHREHLYQLWVLRGHSHLELLVVAYPAMLICAVWAVVLQLGFLPQAKLVAPLSCLLLATTYLFARWRVARLPSGA